MKCQISRWEADIWVFLAQKKLRKNCQNCQLFRPAEANSLPDVGEIRRVYAGQQSTEVVNIWCDLVGKLGISRKNRKGTFSPKIFAFP